jgi:hypothetical protein
MRLLARLLGVFAFVALSGCGGSDDEPAPIGTTPPAAVAPAITTQPASVTVTAGQPATFTVAASGTAPLAYQWKRDGATIAGATSSTYSIASTAVSDNGARFSVTVTNSAGSVTSTEGTLTVAAPVVAPSITTQPASVAVTAGQPAAFTVAASGTAPLAYQWKRNGADLAGATAATYSIAATALADNAARFSVTVTNSAGSVVSNEAVLTVSAAAVAPTITTQPASVSVAAGQPATFSVVATGTAPLSYQWKRDGADIAGANAANFTIATTTAGDSGAQFTVVVINPAGNVTSSAATLTVTPLDRSVAVGPPLSSNLANGFGSGKVTVGILADGSLRALHRPLPADNLILSRFDAVANAWVPASPAVNDRPLGVSNNMATFALDANDIPYVAFVQPLAASTTQFELVLKRLVNGAWENAAPPLQLPGSRALDMSPGEILFDLSNRPVIAFTDPDLGRLRILRLENGVLTALGNSFPQLIAEPTLRMRADGVLVVSYLQGVAGTNGASLTVATFDGTSWTSLPVIDQTFDATQGISSPRLALVGSEPWIAYDRFGGTNTGTLVRRFDGTAWAPVPFVPPLATGGGAIDLEIISGRPALTSFRQDGTTIVLRHDGVAWTDQFDATGATAQPTLRFATRNGTVLLVASNRGINQALVQRLAFP